jgi:hypothetical protein
MKKSLSKLIKPVEPTYPNISDLKKYPISERGLDEDGKVTDKVTQYVKDHRKYYKDKAKYDIDIEIYNQTKFIIDIQRSNLKLCLSKYKISKIK